MLEQAIIAVLITLFNLSPGMSQAATVESTNNNEGNRSNYKLLYFNARWRGEGARLIFAYAGVPYEDVRVTKEEWPKLKPTTPFGHLPVLKFGGHELGESFAINRYLARQFGLAGNGSLEEAYVDSIADFFKDFFEKTGESVKAIITGGGPIDPAYNEIVAPARDAFLPPLERFLKKANSGYVVGNSATWADLIITEYLATCQSAIPGFLSGYPSVESYVNRIRLLSNIKKWIDNRPQSDH
ncbi:Glutathione S-transferase 1 [Toxocara canis]|uniref:Glutathione S-transferase 1 n=1 Tax=Toxocara canis TaxID=6265 RepID=A0A0B2VKR2_TOXCA|nr:Glutathione S-transferase 1 [Toxocara canis]